MAIRPNARTVLSVLAFAGAFALPLPASDPEPDAAHASARVEYVFKIVSPARDHKYRLWNVALRKSSGELFRHAVKGTGDSVRFKDLPPGIYITCIAGEKANEQCRSVDLTPPAGQEFFRFIGQIDAPSAGLNREDVHKVSIKRLAIPNEARRELTRSEEAQLQGKPEEVLKHLRKALEIEPDFPEALNNMGARLRKEKEYAKAAEYLARSVRLDPDFYPGWINLGGCLLAQGKFKAALEANQRALSLRPRESFSNAQVAITYYYLHNYEEAKRYFNMVLSLDPMAASFPQLFLAHISIVQKNEAEAMNHIRGYLELHPNSPQAPRLRQSLLRLEKNGDLAGLAFELASSR